MSDALTNGTSEANGDPRTRLRTARLERRVLEEELQLKALQADKKLMESLLWDWPYSGMDQWEKIRRAQGDDAYAGFLPPSIPSDRRAGAEWPFFRTEWELNQYRQRSRVVCRVNGYASGLVNNTINYVIEQGCKYEVISKEKAPGASKDGEPTSLTTTHSGNWLQEQLAKAQDLLDEFLGRNHVNGSATHLTPGSLVDSRERELVRRVWRDGEAFIRLFKDKETGNVSWRWIEPEQVLNPPGAVWSDGWSFGIQHKVWTEMVTGEDGLSREVRFEDVETIVAYNVRPMSPELSQWASKVSRDPEEPPVVEGYGNDEIVDAADVIHLKGMETDSTVKRGLPFFKFDVLDGAERASALQRAASEGARIRACTAEIWKYINATSAGVTGLAASLRERTRTNPTTGAQENVERVKPGMVRRVPEGQEPVDPPPDYTEQYLHGVQGDLRLLGTAASFPEYLVSGDSSNSNFASTREAGAPAVRAGQSIQGYFTGAFASIAWHVLRFAAKCGKLDAEALPVLHVQVKAPKVAILTELEQSQIAQIDIPLGTQDRKSAAMERGRDWDVVQANNTEYEQEHGGGQMLGLPGEGDDEGGGQHPPNGPPTPSLPDGLKKPKPPAAETRDAPEAIEEGADPLLAYSPRVRELVRGAAVRLLEARLTPEVLLEGWITLSSKDAEGEKHGSTHVYIGSGGHIEKGPSHMVGKKPGELKDHKVTATHGEKHPVTGDKEGPKEKPKKEKPPEKHDKTEPAAKPADTAHHKEIDDAVADLGSYINDMHVRIQGRDVHKVGDGYQFGGAKPEGPTMTEKELTHHLKAGTSPKEPETGTEPTEPEKPTHHEPAELPRAEPSDDPRQKDRDATAAAVAKIPAPKLRAPADTKVRHKGADSLVVGKSDGSDLTTVFDPSHAEASLQAMAPAIGRALGMASQLSDDNILHMETVRQEVKREAPGATDGQINAALSLLAKKGGARGPIQLMITNGAEKNLTDNKGGLNTQGTRAIWRNGAAMETAYIPRGVTPKMVSDLAGGA